MAGTACCCDSAGDRGAVNGSDAREYLTCISPWSIATTIMKLTYPGLWPQSSHVDLAAIAPACPCYPSACAHAKAYTGKVEAGCRIGFAGVRSYMERRGRSVLLSCMTGVGWGP